MKYSRISRIKIPSRQSDLNSFLFISFSLPLTFNLILMLINGSQPQDLMELVLFHPVDNITTSVSSWVITTAIDLQPYEIALNNVLSYVLNVRSGLRSVLHNFNNNDHRYAHIARMTKEDLTSIINEITLTQNEAYNLTNHTKKPRTKRSILPLGGLFNFLCGTADQKDIDMIKQQVKDLYSNQLAERKVLEDIISVTNISRGLINENRLKIQTEASLHHARIRSLLKQLQNDVDLIRQYIPIHATNKLTPNIIDPTHLRQELIKVNLSQL